MDLLYPLVLVANLLCVAAVLYSVRNPGRQIWPPPGRNTWEYWLVIIADSFCTLGVPAVAYLDRGSLGFGGSFTRLLGSAIFLLSVPVVAWAVYTLSLRQSFGLRGSLVTWGPYRYSRNPQYVGVLLDVWGVAPRGGLGEGLGSGGSVPAFHLPGSLQRGDLAEGAVRRGV